MQASDEEHVRRRQERVDKIAAMPKFLDEGLKSGIGVRSKDELFEAARARFAAEEQSDAQ